MTVLATATPPTASPITPDDLLMLPDHGRYELIDGRLVETNVSKLSSWIGGELHALLRNYSRGQDLGWVFPSETLYRCFSWKPNQVRKPDVSYFRAERVRSEDWPEGFVVDAPDLVVEVVSPNDLATVLNTKVREYFRAGVRLIWVVYPETRTVSVHRADDTGLTLVEDRNLDGEDVLPGFAVRVGDLFPPGAPAPSGESA